MLKQNNKHEFGMWFACSYFGWKKKSNPIGSEFIILNECVAQNEWTQVKGEKKIIMLLAWPRNNFQAGVHTDHTEESRHK